LDGYGVSLYDGSWVVKCAASVAGCAAAQGAVEVIFWQGKHVDAGQMVHSTAPITAHHITL
jgi:hypothetical protein